MRIREAYRPRDFGHMDLEVSLGDPKYYTRPFTVKTELNLTPDGDVREFVCAENEIGSSGSGLFLVIQKEHTLELDLLGIERHYEISDIACDIQRHIAVLA